MSRIRSLFAGLMVAGFSVGALGCIDMEDEVVVDDDEVYLESVDEAYVPNEPLRAVLPPEPSGDTHQPDATFLEPVDDAYVPGEPLRAVLPPDPSTGDNDQPDATFLETEGEYVAPSQPLRIDWPDGDDDDDTSDDGFVFESGQRRQ